MSYLPISDYGVIGDLHTAALVGTHGSIDWFCVPRFDSPSVFGALLDHAGGGRWQVAPAGAWTSEQRYLPGTNVLVTSFRLEGGGVLEVTDFMPVGPGRGGRSELHRRVHCPRGPVEAVIRFAPRFNYGATTPALVRRRGGVLATDRDDDALALAAPADVSWEIAGGEATARLPLATGATAWLVLRADDDEVLALDAYESPRKFEETTRWWDAWSAAIRPIGPYRAAVERSALALKLCCYEPTGAIVAAPTTSLPESRGGGRNWDYRYAWLRDSAFVLYALDLLGSAAEGDAFLGFLKRVCRRAAQGHLQIMYAVDGGRDLAERMLDHLEGYGGARPVRVGNAAAGQRQLDVYGEVLLAASIWRRRRPMTEGVWDVLRGLVDWTASHWQEPDWSIWEARLDAKHYVFSKVLAWAALDRGAALAEELSLPGDRAGWRREAEALRADVLARGWDGERQTFVQAYDEPQLDASVLVIPKIRFLDRRDPRVRSTLAAVRRELASPAEELIFRYRTADGEAGEEGAFLVCSFWMIQNLAMVGELDEAERLFRNILRRVSPVGLLPEEIDPATGAFLGNFPQALSHAALINTAHVLDRLRSRSAQPSALAASPP